MSEVAAALAQQQGGDPVQQQGGDPVQQQRREPPGWMSGLTAEFNDDARDRLARYQSVDDLAKSLVETQDWARGRIPLPDDTAEGWENFAGKLRPESADKYTFDTGENADSNMADWFRGAAFDSGLHPKQAELLNKRWNQYAQDLVAKAKQTAHDELKAIELQNPAHYARANIAIDSMLKAAGLDLAGEDGLGIDQFEAKVGAGKTWKFLESMAARFGELDKVDGVHVDLELGNMTPEQAGEAVKRMIADPETHAKMRQEGTPENAKYKRLVRIQAGG